MNRLTLRRAGSIVGVALTLLLVGYSSALAATATTSNDADAEESDAQTWAVTPATVDGPDERDNFSYIANPGDTYDEYVAVRNFGDEEITVDLYAQDATVSEWGAFDLLTADEQATGVGLWADLPHQQVVVPAGDDVVVAFELAVPEDAEPGDHAGGIVAVVETESEGISYSYRAGVRIYVRVAGEVAPELELESQYAAYHHRISPIASGSATVDYTVVNHGNIRITAVPQITIEGLFGLWSTTIEADEIPELLRDSAYTGSVSVDSVLPLGPLTVTISASEVLSDGQDVTDLTTITEYTTTIWAIPWSAIVTVVLLAGVSVAVVLALRSRKRASALSATGQTDAESEPDPS